MLPKIRYTKINNDKTRVTLEGKIVGTIKKVHIINYQYFPVGDEDGGEFFNTEKECRESLEND